MKRCPRTVAFAAALLITSLAGVAHAQDPGGCRNTLLRGGYVFSATGYTRPNASTPWVPKAIVEMLEFDGNGTVTVPAVTVVNPFGDMGQILEPPSPSAGIYTVYANCTGTILFADGVAFRIHVSPRGGNEFWMIQTAGLNGSQNVFQGKAERAW